MALTAYLTQTLALLHDANNVFWTQTNLTTWINLARKRVAAEGQCIRVLPSGVNSVVGQEVYTYASFNTQVQVTPGVNNILFVQTIAVNWGALKPTLDYMVWNDFQAYLRSYSVSLQGQPAIWSQYGQGVGGSAYLWPVPSSVAAMDWDCVCLPILLVDDTTVEAIPDPWTDAVPYYAAYLGLMNARRPEEAKNMFSVYKEYMSGSRVWAEPMMIPTYYA